MRYVNRHPDRIHPRDQFPAERRKPSVVAHFATVAGLVSRVIGELRQPLAHPVESVNVIRASEVIRILHAKDNPDPAFGLCSRQIVRVIHAHEIVRIFFDKSVPFLEPPQGYAVRPGRLERDRRMENVNPGAPQLQKIPGSKCRWDLLPSIEQRPVQSKQAEHIDDVRIRDQIDSPPGTGGA
jgi:hypothetical protein